MAAITLTPSAVYTPTFRNTKSGIGAREAYRLGVKTNRSFNIPAPTTANPFQKIRIAVRIADMVDPSFSNEPVSFPTDNYYYFDLDNSNSPLVAYGSAPDHQMLFSTSGSPSPHFNLFSVFVKCHRLGANWEIAVFVHWVNFADLKGYLDSSPVNRDMLLRDSRLATSDLNNLSDLTDYYNTNVNEFRIALYVRDYDGYVSSYISKQTRAGMFWNRDNFNAVPTAYTSPQWQLFNGSYDCPTNTLSSLNPTYLRFTADYPFPTTYVDTQQFVGAFRVDKTDNNSHYLTNYEAFCRRVNNIADDYYQLTATADVGAFLVPVIGIVPHQLSASPPNYIVGSTGVQTALYSPVSKSFDVQLAPMPLGSRWRFFVVNYLNNPASPDVFTILSDEYVVSDCPCRFDPLVEQGSGIYDYNGFLGDYAGTSVKERLISVLTLNCQHYNNVYPLRPVGDALKSVRFRVYSLDGNYRHVYYDRTVTRDVNGNLVNASPEVGIVYLSVDQLQVSYSFRNRWESWLPNLYTEIGSVQQQGLETNDWSGKDIYIEYSIKLQQQDGSQDFYVYTHRNYVRPADTTMSEYVPHLTLFNCNADVAIVCNELMQVCVEKVNPCQVGATEHIALIDAPSYGVTSVEEEDALTVPVPLPLPILHSNKILSFADNAYEWCGIDMSPVCWVVDTSQLSYNVPYVFNALMVGHPTALMLGNGSFGAPPIYGFVREQLAGQFEDIKQTDFTVELWVKFLNQPDSANACGFFEYNYLGAVNQYAIRFALTSSTTLSIRLYDNGGGFAEAVYTGFVFNTVDWYQLVAVRNGDDVADLKIYINGLPLITVNTDSSYAWSVPVPDVNGGAGDEVVVGRRVFNNGNCLYKQLRFYNRALGDVEVVRNFNLGYSNNPYNSDAMLNYVMFDELPYSGVPLQDSTFPCNGGLVPEWSIVYAPATPNDLMCETRYWVLLNM